MGKFSFVFDLFSLHVSDFGPGVNLIQHINALRVSEIYPADSVAMRQFKIISIFSHLHI